MEKKKAITTEDVVLTTTSDSLYLVALTPGFGSLFREAI